LLTVHYFHHKEWTTCGDWRILPNKHRKGREYVFLTEVTSISSKRLEITIPDLEIQRGKRIIKYRRDITLANLLLYSIPRHAMTEAYVIITEAQLQQGSLRTLLHNAAGLNLMTPQDSNTFIERATALDNLFIKIRYAKSNN